ncbi:MAG: tripartite tricarboxylate transporter substrate binding protein [Pigmentiphaga sp.]|uniref:Bug family tripartite tricarboxylate transporter substrate binding protein n=1 Tax=Pigmentiphaga sp. TaxID=1977564 RepID=UPI0029BB3515|nr:tripartite tricarboxylate transporter substrate binding protein [Pigmentiphaga sp.]MDX3906688.1 tripartite tricarboxylate transporter substrate binding protein [Pigmentiphaga sp.]
MVLVVRTALPLLAVALGCAPHASAPAQTSYPNRALTMVVPFPAGGPTDLIARVLGKTLSDSLGQPVAVENRPGATGNIGAAHVARARPDGYTLLLGTNNTHGGNPALYKSTGYDAVADFRPIGQIAYQRNSLVASPHAPFSTVAELVRRARSQPETIRYASLGNGSGAHVAGALLQLSSHTQMTHVPYKGIAPALIDLMRGEVDIMYVGLPSAMPYLREGKLKALAVDGEQRSPDLPQVPTLAESGFPGIAIEPWYGLLVPAGTPDAIVRRLSRETLKALDDPALRKQFLDAGFQIRGSTPEEFGNFIRSELAQWSERIRLSGARLD